MVRWLKYATIVGVIGGALLYPQLITAALGAVSGVVKGAFEVARG